MAPVPLNDELEGTADGPLEIAPHELTENDDDPDGDPAFVIAVSDASNGSVAIDPTSGRIVFTPADGFSGEASFAYTVDDGWGETATATVTVNVTVDTVPPIIEAGQVFANAENQSIAAILGTVLASDNGAVTEFAIIAGNNDGYFTIDDDGNIALTDIGANAAPNDFETGPNSFTLTVEAADAAGNTSQEDVTLNVTDVPDTDVTAPDIPSGQTFSYVENHDAATALGTVAASDNVAVTTFAIVVGDPDGFFAIDHFGNVILTAAGASAAANDFDSAPNSFTLSVEATDAAGNASTEDVTLTVVEAPNSPAVAVDDSAETEANQPLVFSVADLLANDTDADEDTLTFVGVLNSEHGSAAFDLPTGTVTFTPSPDFAGEAGFDYTIDDGNGGTDIGRVTVTVVGTSSNIAPSLVDGLGGPADFGENILPANDDESTEPIDITSVFGPEGLNFFGTSYTNLYVNNNGNLTFNAPLVSFTPDVIDAGSNNPIIAPFWADVDTRGAPSSVTPDGTSQGTGLVYYDLDTTNDVFTATWDDVGYFSFGQDRLNAFQVQLTDRGDGDFDIVFRYEVVNWTTGGASGGSGGLGGTPARAGYSAGNAVDSFELPQSGDQSAILQLEETVGNTGDVGIWQFQVRNGVVVIPPRAVDDAYEVERDEILTVPVAIGILGNDNDVDGDVVSLVLDTDVTNGTLSLAPNGSFTYTPDADFFGTDNFTYRAVDNDGALSAPATVTITVDGETEPPSLEVGLYNADTDELIGLIEDGTTLDLGELPDAPLTIAAVVPDGSSFDGVVESMVLDLNDGAIRRRENVEPYALFGDIEGDFGGSRTFLEPGTNQITFELYSEDRARGDLIEMVTRDFTVVGAPSLEVGLYNADTDELIGLIEDGTTLDLGELPDAPLTIAAVVPDGSSFDGVVESMVLDLNDGAVRRRENVEPYALFGDIEGDFGGSRTFLEPGMNQITFELYSEDRTRGELIETVTRDFTVTEPPSLEVGLYNADTDELIGLIEDGTTLDLGELPDAPLTIAAVVPDDSSFDGVVESMVLDLNDGAVRRRENVEPYALFGDIEGDFGGSRTFLEPGMNQITFEIFGQRDARGDPLGTLTRTLTIVDGVADDIFG